VLEGAIPSGPGRSPDIPATPSRAQSVERRSPGLSSFQQIEIGRSSLKLVK
jgi:hypothetical protein